MVIVFHCWDWAPMETLERWEDQLVFIQSGINFGVYAWFTTATLCNMGVSVFIACTDWINFQYNTWIWTCIIWTALQTAAWSQTETSQIILTSCVELQQTPRGTALECVKLAIDVGYRHFDGALVYFNEHEVGQAIRDKIADGTVRREDIFYCGKVMHILYIFSYVFQYISNAAPFSIHTN